MNDWISWHKSSGLSENPRLSVRQKGFAFNAVFMSMSRNRNAKFVTLSLYPQKQLIGFCFHHSKVEGAYTLTSDGGNRKGTVGRAVQLQSLMNKHPWIRTSQRHFEPKWNPYQKQWEISLGPSFELSVTDPHQIPSNAVGNYRYLYQGDIVYEGHGEIRKRALATERRDWMIDRIEYSIIPDREERRRWESYRLDKHKEIYGTLPKYNLIGGKRTVVSPESNSPKKERTHLSNLQDTIL